MVKYLCSENCPTWCHIVCVQMVCYWDEFGHFSMLKLKNFGGNLPHPKQNQKKQEEEKEAVIRITRDEPFCLCQFTKGGQTK